MLKYFLSNYVRDANSIIITYQTSEICAIQ